MARKHFNRVRHACATAGTGTVTLGSAYSNKFLTFAEAGITDADTVTYCIEEGNDFEIGEGVYTAAGTTLTRATVIVSKIGGTSGTTKMTLAGAATVRGIASARDFMKALRFDEAQTLSGGELTQARSNLGLGSAAVLAETTTAEYRANTADRALSTDQVWAAGALVALTDAATVAVDMSAGLNFSLTIGGNRTLGSPTNVKVGQTGKIVITQDGTGSRTLAYGADWEFAGGTAPTLSTAAGAKDILFYDVLATGSVFASLVKAVS